MVMVSYCYKIHSEMSVIDIAGMADETSEVWMTSDKERFGQSGIILKFATYELHSVTRG